MHILLAGILVCIAAVVLVVAATGAPVLMAIEAVIWVFATLLLAGGRDHRFSELEPPRVGGQVRPARRK